jgi:hypothetical protein
LLDEPSTSHPFFWGAFMLIGDGADAPSGNGTPTRSAALQ